MIIGIKDVAKETNLSIATISKYMNGGKVREDNRQKIELAIKKLGYRPNELARGLRGSGTHTIGVMIHNYKAAFSAKLVGEIEKELKKKGYSIILCGHEGLLKSAEEIAEFFLSKQVDGMIIEPISGAEKIFDSFIENKKPIIAVDRPMDMKKYDSVTTNSMLGIYQGVEYLLQKGHKKIGMITGGKRATKNMNTSIERLKGFKRAIEDYDLEIPEKWIVKGDFTLESGYEAMKRLWECEEHPTAVIVGNYYMCVGMMKAIHELGIRIPKELSIISMDNMAFSWICNPKITSICQPVEEIAKATVEVMMKRLEGDYMNFPQTVKLHTYFIERDSVSQSLPS